MKIDKYKDVYNKINMDASMDKNIKEKLMYYDPQTEGMEQKKRYIRTNYRGGIGSFFHTINKLSVVKAALPSIAFLVFMVVIVFSIKARMENDVSVAKSQDETSEEANDRSDVDMHSDIVSFVSEAPIQFENDDSAQLNADGFEGSTDPATEITASVTPTGEETATQGQDTAPMEGAEITDTSGPEITDLAGTEVWSSKEDEVIAQTDISLEQSVNNSNSPGEEDASQAAGEAGQVNPGDFYFASFDVINENNVKAAIPNLVIRLHGEVNSIDPADLTDIVLTLDGVPIDNGITLTDRVEQFNWCYEEITDFYFKFDYENRNPGIYGLTGKYKGEAFTVYDKIIEEAVTDEPADLADLSQVGWGYYADENEQPQKVSELVFYFSGIQNAFYQSDLSELKVTLNGNEITYSFMDRVFRYLEYNGVDGGDTSFNLVLNEAFTQSGTYVVTGKYRGQSFTSQAIIIP